MLEIAVCLSVHNQSWWGGGGLVPELWQQLRHIYEFPPPYAINQLIWHWREAFHNVHPILAQGAMVAPKGNKLQNAIAATAIDVGESGRLPVVLPESKGGAGVL